jgi:hypothetical protein
MHATRKAVVVAAGSVVFVFAGGGSSLTVTGGSAHAEVSPQQEGSTSSAGARPDGGPAGK